MRKLSHRGVSYLLRVSQLGKWEHRDLNRSHLTPEPTLFTLGLALVICKAQTVVVREAEVDGHLLG